MNSKSMDTAYFSILSLNLIIILGIETLFFIWAYFRLRNDIADILWGLGFSFVAASTLLQSSNSALSPSQCLLLAVIVAWSLRLAGYLGYRTRNSPEDARYAAMRVKWGADWVKNSFIYVFLMQGFLLWLLSLSLQTTLIRTQNQAEISLVQVIGFAVAFFGLIYETVADLQKSNFKKKHPAKTQFIQSGLFKYSRYPQYFGEITFWLGISIYGLELGWPALGILCPVVLGLLLRYFSGVPLLEANYHQRPGYAEYANNTPLFIPKIF